MLSYSHYCNCFSYIFNYISLFYLTKYLFFFFLIICVSLSSGARLAPWGVRLGPRTLCALVRLVPLKTLIYPKLFLKLLMNWNNLLIYCLLVWSSINKYFPLFLPAQIQQLSVPLGLVMWAWIIIITIFKLGQADFLNF